MNYVDDFHCNEINSLYYMAECAYFLSDGLAFYIKLIVLALSLYSFKKINIYNINDLMVYSLQHV
jgi:hypothetical protein